MDGITSISRIDEPLLAAICRDMRHPVMLCDRRGLICYANRAMLALCRKSGVPMPDDRADRLGNIFPDQPAPALQKVLQLALGLTTPLPLPQLMHLSSEGELVPLQVRRIMGGASPMLLIEPQPVDNVVKRLGELDRCLKASDSALRRERLARIDLERMLSGMETFSATAAHDLRSPLAHIYTTLELLAMQLGDKLSSNEREYLSLAKDSSMRLIGLIDDLLLLAKSQHGGITPRPIDLDDILASVKKDLGHEVAAAKARLVIGDLTALNGLEGDAGLIHALFQNLLQNALKYRHQDRNPHVTVSATRQDAQLVLVSVEDNGIGFDEAAASRMFTPFQRFTRQAEHESTGLGLATVHQICERHGWQVIPHGQPGIGARFDIHIPLAAC